MNKMRGKGGFALIVVLGSLSIIALLFAGASTRMLARMTDTSSEVTLLRIQQESAALARLGAQVYGTAENQRPPDMPLPVPWLDETALLRLQDVGGLVDLNTASVDLMNRLAEALGVSSQALRQFRDWRRTPYRLQTVADFPRVSGTDPALAARLERIATVHSARIGFAPDHAPQDLLDLLGGEDAVPDSFRTESTGSVFKLWLETDTKPPRYLGTIRIGSADHRGQIIE